MLNKSELRGTKKVFLFTLTQFLKSKSNIISLVILIIAALASVPVLTMASGGSIDVSEVSNVSTVYINNETGLDLQLSSILEQSQDKYFINTTFVDAVFDDESEFTQNVSDDQLYVRIFEDSESGIVNCEINETAGSSVSAFDTSAIYNLISSAVKQAQFRAEGMPSESIALLTTPFEVNIDDVANYSSEQQASWGLQYAVQLIYSVVVMMMSIFAVTYIIRTVVEEKASKLIELLMVSIKPLALIVGKILAAMVYVFGSFLLLGICFAISYFVSGMFMDVSAIAQSFGGMGSLQELVKLDFSTVFVVLISMVLGYLTFSIIAGLSGTGCSSTDDIQGAATLSTMLIMAGYMASVFVSSMGTEVGGTGVAVLASLCPIISVFCAPAQYMLGNISFVILLISWIIQAAVVIFLAKFAASIYTGLLMYRGNRVTIGKMISMSRKQLLERRKD